MLVRRSSLSLSLIVGAFALASFFTPQSGFAILHFEGFEDPGYVQGGDNWNNLSGATIARAASGTAGITSSSGVAHATLTPGNGPFTRFGGYSSNFAGGFTAQLDIYLDPAAWSNEEGFDYSVAVNNQAGNHRRDFIFHVGMVGTDFLVNASNNTNFDFSAFKLNNENSMNNYTLTDAGWYTFEQDFRDDGGVLAVDFNLYDDSDTLLYTVTRSDPSDLIATDIGGNRYGWFTYNDQNGLAIDNTNLVAVPEASTILVWSALSLGFGTTVAFRRKRSQNAA